jgi:hypothetical protein
MGMLISEEKESRFFKDAFSIVIYLKDLGLTIYKNQGKKSLLRKRKRLRGATELGF